MVEPCDTVSLSVERGSSPSGEWSVSRNYIFIYILCSVLLGPQKYHKTFDRAYGFNAKPGIERHRRVRLEYTLYKIQRDKNQNARPHARHLGLCGAVTPWRDQEAGLRALRQECVPGLGCSDVSRQWCAQEAA